MHRDLRSGAVTTAHTFPDGWVRLEVTPEEVRRLVVSSALAVLLATAASQE
jgi:hypothetical protein